MNPRTTRWLMVLALGLGAFIFLFERRLTDTEQRLDLATRLFHDLTPGEVTGLDLTRGTNFGLRLEHTNDQWRFKVPVVYPAQPGSVERLIAAVAQLRHHGHITAQEILAQTNGLAAFGFEPPSATLTLHQGGRLFEVRLGARMVLGRQVYLQVVGRDGLFAVDAEFLRTWPSSADAWRDTTLLDLSGLEFNWLKVRPATNGFEVVRNPTNRLWQMTKPLFTRAHNARIEFFLRQLQMARVQHFVTDAPRADLEPYGLLPPERELVFAQGTNDVLRLQIGQSPTNDASQVFVRCLIYSNVVLVSRAAIEPWLASFREFCDPRLAVFEHEAVDRIEVLADEQFALQRQTNGAWSVVQPYLAPADSVLVLEMLADLAGLECEFVEEVVSDFTAYGLAPPRRLYALKTTFTGPAGVPTNQVVAQVDFGNPTGHKVFARRSLENSVVKTLDNDRLPRAAFQLRDRRLWNFSTNQIASITIQQQGRTRKLLRTGPMQWTHAPGSQGVISNFTLEEAAWRLGHLHAANWVAGGEAQLARYGFPATDHQIAIELAGGDKPQLFTIRFGRRAASGRTLAAVPSPEQAGPLIFECPPSIYEFVFRDLTAPAPP